MSAIKIQEKQKDIPRNVIRASRSERILTYVMVGDIIVLPIIWLLSLEMAYEWILYVYCGANIFFLLPMAFCFWILASFWKVFHIRARYFFYYILWIVPYGLILWGLAHPY